MEGEEGDIIIPAFNRISIPLFHVSRKYSPRETIAYLFFSILSSLSFSVSLLFYLSIALKARGGRVFFNGEGRERNLLLIKIIQSSAPIVLTFSFLSSFFFFLSSRF